MENPRAKGPGLPSLAASAGLGAGAHRTWLVPAPWCGPAWWIAWAWNQERRWSWWAVMALAALNAGSNVLGLASGFSWWRLAWLVCDAVFVALLAHPDSTARLEPRARPARAPQWVPDRPPQG